MLVRFAEGAMEQVRAPSGETSVRRAAAESPARRLRTGTVRTSLAEKARPTKQIDEASRVPRGDARQRGFVARAMHREMAMSTRARVGRVRSRRPGITVRWRLWWWMTAGVAIACGSAGCEGFVDLAPPEPGVYASVTGVGAGTPPHFPPIDRGFLDATRASGAQGLPCPATQVTPAKIGALRFSAAGCGQILRFTAVSEPGNVWSLHREVSATSGETFANDANDDDGLLKATRASGAYDLQCRAPIVAQEIRHPRTSSNYLAEGCGHRATYVNDGVRLLLTSIVRIVPPAVAP